MKISGISTLPYTQFMVYTEPGEGQDEYVVYWTTGGKKGGIFNVVVTDNIEDKKVAAELSVMQELLVTRQIFGADRAGNSLKIHCSSGAIKNLQKLRSAKLHLIDYAFFLSTRFADANVVTDKKCTCKKFLNETYAPELIEVKGPSTMFIEINGVGAAELTRHALQQFAKRHQIEDESRAWRKLTALAKDDSVRKISLPKWVERHKEALYSVPAQYFYNPENHWNFTVIEVGERKVLATAYIHPQTEVQYIEERIDQEHARK